MELSELLVALSAPAAFGLPPGTDVEVVQTHISVVFLVGDDAYKLKKPVTLEFLDYSTLARRKRFCELEVSLNRRLARDVYLGVVPVVRGDSGVTVGGEGEIVDFVVHMRRLDDAAQLGARIASGEADAALLDRIGRRVAGFHRAAESGPKVSAWATFDRVAAHCRQNLRYVAPLDFVSPQLVARVERLTEEALERSRGAIERRASAMVARDTHGDLRLDHIYLLPEEAPPDDLVIVDCIEFGEHFRCVDPISDLAFLVMDLHRVGREDLADALVAGYFEELAAGGPLGLPEGGASPVDELAEGRALLPLYAAYRAAVRAKVDGLKARDPLVPREARREAEESVHRHLLLALRELAPRGERPCLLLVMGLPGTGKSTLARAIAEEGFTCVRSDVVRKRLAGLSPEERAVAAPGEGIYSPEWSDRTYAACLAEARADLLEGGRVIVDANFRAEGRRAPFLALSRELGVPLRVIVCTADEAIVAERLARREGDASDADLDVYVRAREEWEPLGEGLASVVIEVDTGVAPSESAARVREGLREAGLVE